jgi:TRAP-type transport system periplasmic protein
MNKRFVTQVLTGLVLSSGALAAQAETKLILNNFFPPSHFIRGVFEQWTADVTAATDGRITFEVPAGSLAAPPQQVSAVKSGIADLAITANVFVQKQAPMLSYSSLPFLINDAEAASVANWRTYDKFLADKAPLDRLGVETLSVFNYSGGHLYGLEDEPIQSLETLQSKRVWALPGYTAENIKNMGISPITGPAVQVSETVAKGVVDAFYGISFESVTDFKAAPYTKNIVQFPFSGTSTSFSLFINKRAWSRIGAEDQAVIRNLAGEALARKVGAAAKAASAKALADMEADGINVVQADPALYAAFQDAARPLFDDFSKDAEKAGIDATAMLEFFKSEYAREGGK